LIRLRDKSSLASAKAYAKRESAILPERHVKPFRNGRNQAVRISREFELSGEDAVMRKDGDTLIIEPAAPKSLLYPGAARRGVSTNS